MTISSAELIVRTSSVEIASHDLATPEHRVTNQYQKQFTTGTGADQFDLIFSDTRTLSASTSEDLDLAGVLTGVFGAVLTMVEVVMIKISAAAANTNNVLVGAATAPVAMLAGAGAATASVPVKPGGCFCLCAPNAAGMFTVGAGTTDDLKIENSGAGTSVTYTVEIWGRSA